MADTDLHTAEDRDACDELASFRQEFELPLRGSGGPETYLCGHSLGLLPRAARTLIDRELERWSARAVDGHFDNDGWFAYHERFSPPLASLLGVEAAEVIAMNSLTVNLHLMLASFFRPSGERCRVVIERSAFPSDRYAVQSQLKWHGLDPETDLVELDSESGHVTAAALDAELTSQQGRVALVLLPGVQYLTGAALDLRACAAVARKHGALVGFDLAHAIGNLALDLRSCEPDFAVWCSYKYLNAGPGAIGGCFVNRRWLDDDELIRLAGWWGHDKKTRFESRDRFEPMPTAEAWQLSNPPILAMAPLEASLALFEAAGTERLRAKSRALTSYLQTLITDLIADRVTVITPDTARGAQLSIRIERPADRSSELIKKLKGAGVVADWREPDTLRMAPVPLYNSFVDVHTAATALASALAG